MAKSKRKTSLRTRFEIFKRDNFICQYCGRKTPEVILEIDHIIPVSKKGDDSEDNLITSCFECNRGKSDSLLNTILKNKDIHTETLLLAEKELQLAEYNNIKNKIRERENSNILELKQYFAFKFGNYSNYAGIEFDKIISFIRSYLKIGSYLDLFDKIDYAINITEKDSQGDYHNVAACKYLAGIIRNILKGEKVG